MNNIGFKNIKVFKDWRNFDFKNITLLTGTNNSGKSSVINAMQMLQENLTAKNLDELLSTEFVLKANQNKYGSIGSFVNNKSGDDVIQLTRIIDNYKYAINIKIIDGIQTKGIVHGISVRCINTDEIIFIMKVDEPYPNLTCTFNINYKYFLNKFYKKCENTLLYYKKIEVIQEKIDRLNKGEIHLINELESEIKQIGKEFKLEIHLGIMSWWSKDLVNGLVKEYTLESFFQDGNILYDLSEDSLHKQVVLSYLDEDSEKKKGGLSFRKSGQSVLHKEIFNQKFLMPYKHGILNFSNVWEDDEIGKIKFESLISNYYNKNFEEAYKLFCDDWVNLSSCYVWKMQHQYSDFYLDALDDPKVSLAKRYINSLVDFGTIGNEINYKKNKEGESWRGELSKDLDTDTVYSKVADAKIYATSQYIRDFAAQKDISSNVSKNTAFKDFIENDITPLLKDYFWNDDNNFSKRKKIINPNTFKVIENDIKQILINANLCFQNLYVSSSRFTTKRAYSFNDNTDFTNLLSQIENIKDVEKKNIINNFISKWLKEFDIADELILQPDADTGNFKAFLKKDDLNITLADYGLGTNQLLPILFSVSLANNVTSKTVVIEEPEANLHPAMQSKLADMFADAIKTFKIKIIAETHSEYLIRKLQYLVASNKSELKPDDVVIYYFNKPNNPDVLSGETEQVKKIEIDEFGRLNKEFGKGFFDEADNIAMELFLLQQSQSN